MTEAEKVAGALKGRKFGTFWMCFCPAHENTRTPALSVSEGLNGKLLVKCHAGCDGTSVLSLLRQKGIIGEKSAVEPTVDPVGFARRRAAARRQVRGRQKAADELFGAGTGIAGTLVETYLESRGIMDVRLHRMVQTLRYHAATLHSPTGTYLPAMLARIRGVRGEPLGIHRTYLRSDGRAKADVNPAKMMLGPSSGGAVRFGSDERIIMLAEGIETALSVALASRLTVWATLSTSGLKGLILPPLPMAEMVIVAADHDEAGLSAAKETTERLRNEGRLVSVIYPPAHGTDFNDLLREKAR